MTGGVADERYAAIYSQVSCWVDCFPLIGHGCMEDESGN